MSKFYKAAISHWEAQRDNAIATLELYFLKSVGIGEHPQHVDEADKLVEKIANAEEKIRVLQEFKI